MKKLMLIAAIVGFALVANAQTTKQESKKEKTKTEMKDHVCTSACKDGQHMYAHGEKGHVCGKACNKKKKM